MYEQIRIVYDIGPTPKFHYDIEGLDEYYVLPKRNCFFAAYDGDKIVATGAIRAYDKDYELFKGEYNEDNQFIFDYYFPYLRGIQISSYEDISIERHAEKESYAGVCDDIKVGVTLWLLSFMIFAVISDEAGITKLYFFAASDDGSLQS